MGEVLIAGTASLLICVFLSPKFIAFLRAREFGQNIREDGPEGHHAKAGTPTMGGIIIFTAIAVPFLLLTDDCDWRVVGRVRRGRGVRAAGLRRRLHEARQTAFAGAARADEAVRHGADLDRALARRHQGRRAAGHGQPADRGRLDRPRLPVSRLHLPGGGGDDVGGQPDRRAGRAGGGLRGDRPAGLHRDHVHDRAARARRWSPAAWSARASGSCGSTRSRRRSSWGTPARWGLAARSRAWP